MSPANDHLHQTKRRRAILLAQIAVVATAPAVLFAFSSFPAGFAGAPGEGTCASCHGGGSGGTGSVAVTFSGGGANYTPGTPQTLTVTVNETGALRYGFSITARTSANAQAGSFTAGAGSTVKTSGTLQYVGQSSPASPGTWSFTWTPPATSTGNVTFYVAGVASIRGTSGDVFTTSASLAPAVSTSNTVTVSPSALTFNANGASSPPSQSVQVTSSGAPLAFTTSATTNSGGNWLSAVPAGGTTPLAVTVSVNSAGLAANTYTGTVTITAVSASNSPQTVNVTLNVSGASTLPALTLTPAALTFNSQNGAAAPSPNVQVTSTGAPLTFSATTATVSGGNWLSVSPVNGTTRATAVVSVNPAGLSPGTTYSGSVTFTSTGASNSPQTLRVSLVVSGSQPPPGTPGPLTFSFHVLDRQSDGSDRMLLDGQGAIDAGGQITGGGSFTRFFSAGSGGSDDGEDHRTSSMGAWKATGITSFTPAAGGGRSGGILEITVQLSPIGSAPMTGTMRIAATGSDSGVTVSINGGATFVPTGTGNVSIRQGSSSQEGGDREVDR